MKLCLPVLALLGFATLLVTQRAAALPSIGLQSLSSPDGVFKAVLSDADAKDHSTPGSPKWLTITDRDRQVARYRFDGEMVSGYWSPSEKYLAINNHYGHRAWAVWIISLHSGTVIRANGSTRTSDYDAYSDEDELPDIYRAAKGILHRLNPNSDDYFRGEPITVTYGWSDDHKLKMFHEFVSGKLADSENTKLWLTSIFEITPVGIKIRGLKGEKVSLNTDYPPSIRPVLQ